MRDLSVQAANDGVATDTAKQAILSEMAELESS